jgi:hypothetical protein
VSEAETAPKRGLSDNLIELIVAILLGITAVLTAWAAWQASLYGGQQATKYTQGTALVAEGNSMYSSAQQALASDMELYSEYWALMVDETFAETTGKTDEMEAIQYKTAQVERRFSTELAEQVAKVAGEAEASGSEDFSPFDDETFVASYFVDAEARIAEGNSQISAGQVDNHLGDILNMATVIYAISLFLLGICSGFSVKSVQLGLIVVSVAAIAVGAYFMLSIPVVTDF